MSIRLPITFAQLATAALLCAGCVEPQPAPSPPTVVMGTAPTTITTYPRATYAGRPVYYYQEHWWYDDGGRWVYLRDEPEELVRARRTWVAAPPPPPPPTATAVPVR